MTNLDSILKGRDITLPTKVRLVKAMVSPVVMYGCASWIMMGLDSTMDFTFIRWVTLAKVLNFFESQFSYL